LQTRSAELDTKTRPARESAADAAGSPAIHAVELAKRYGATIALAGLSMTVPRGEVFGYLGPNGAGKTTSMKLFMGLARPSSGEAWLLGAPIGDRPTRRRIGYLPELFRYQGWLSAREVLGLHCELARIARPDWKSEIDQALAAVGLADRADDRVATFSKGMQQRLGLGVALLGRPDLVLLDEPTSALDPVGRHDVREIIRGLKARNTTVFLNSHLLSEVEQVCDRVAVVDHGRVIAVGTLDELLGGTAVRARVTGLQAQDLERLAHFGKLSDEGEWLTVEGLAKERVPELVAEMVRLGGRVYAVEPRHQTLEDRFLQLLEDEAR
jgi:ABC-2 type transport system ATP-binding protein